MRVNCSTSKEWRAMGELTTFEIEREEMSGLTRSWLVLGTVEVAYSSQALAAFFGAQKWNATEYGPSVLVPSGDHAPQPGLYRVLDRRSGYTAVHEFTVAVQQVLDIRAAEPDPVVEPIAA